jgi:hypothetical protein
MIALVALTLFGATVFVEQELPGLEVGSKRFPTSVVSCNADTADVNGDGQTDLVLPDFVRLQIAGRFPDSGRIRTPENGDFVVSRVEGDLFYGYRSPRLACYRLLDNEWSLFWEEALPAEIVSAAAPIFHDVDGDGSVELLVASDAILRVFHLARGIYSAGALDVFPPRRPRLEPVHDLWRPYVGNGAITAASRRFRLAFAGATLTVHELLDGGPNTFEHRSTEFRIEPGVGEVLQAVQQRRSTVSDLPSFLAPCLIDADATIDHAGVREAPGAAVPWSPPITDIVVAIAGRDRQAIRTKAPTSGVSIADVDADGDADIVVETNDYLNGPPREVILSVTSKRRFLQTISVHVQEVGGIFSRAPRELLTVLMRFDEPLSVGSARWNAYRSCWITSTQGDFNGDKRADFAICDAPGRISVFINHEGLFHGNEDLSLPIPRGYTRFAVADVDRDAKSDIVALPDHGSSEPPRVFFSR